MKAPKKTSRNRQRKAAYAAMANKSSRNQDALPGPVIGHFETVKSETRYVYGEDGTVIRKYEVPVKPYERIVHEEARARQKKEIPTP